MAEGIESFVPGFKRILIVSRMLPDAGSNGSSSHMRSLIEYLAVQNCDVYYLCLGDMVGRNFDASLPCREWFFPASDACVSRKMFDEPPDSAELRQFAAVCNQVRPDYVIADYSWMAQVFDAIPLDSKVGRIIFCHDLRSRILPSLARMGFRVDMSPWADGREGDFLRKAHAIMALNDEDADACREMAPGVKVISIGVAMESRHCPPELVVQGRCFYVASRTQENLFSLAWLLGRVWPSVREQMPSATLMVCGNVGAFLPELAQLGFGDLDELTASGVVLAGRVPDLHGAYASAAVCLVPHWMDGGIKLKMVEAIAHGKAIVSTRAGLDGMRFAVGACALMADEPVDFANAVVAVLRSDQLRNHLELNARVIAVCHLSPAAAFGNVRNYINC